MLQRCRATLLLTPMVGEHVEKYLTVEPMIEYSKITAMPSQHAIWMQAKSLTALPGIVARIFRFSPSRLYHHLLSERADGGVSRSSKACQLVWMDSTAEFGSHEASSADGAWNPISNLGLDYNSWPSGLGKVRQSPIQPQVGRRERIED